MATQQCFHLFALALFTLSGDFTQVVHVSATECELSSESSEEYSSSCSDPWTRPGD